MYKGGLVPGVGGGGVGVGGGGGDPTSKSHFLFGVFLYSSRQGYFNTTPIEGKKSKISWIV